MSSPNQNQFTEVADVYDDLMAGVPYALWVRYVRDLWDRYETDPYRVLDLACGTGNVLLELHRAGYEVEGADYSAGMLQTASRKVGRDVRLWHQDARFLNLPGPPFDACVCLFDSLNYLLEPEHLLQAFHSVRRALREGGSFVFDMNAILALEAGMFTQRGTGRDSGLEFDWHSEWDAHRRLCTIRMEFHSHEQAGTRVFHETHVQRGYTLDEVQDALETADFSVLAFHDAFTFRPTHARTDRFHCIARAR